MDTGLGQFAEISPEVAQQIPSPPIGVFRVGEEIEIRGSRFRIQSIGKSKMKLKLLRPLSPKEGN